MLSITHGCFADSLIPLRAKRVEEFIEIRHNKISLTRILGTLECLSSIDLGLYAQADRISLVMSNIPFFKKTRAL